MIQPKWTIGNAMLLITLRANIAMLIKPDIADSSRKKIEKKNLLETA